MPRVAAETTSEYGNNNDHASEVVAAPVLVVHLINIELPPG